MGWVNWWGLVLNLLGTVMVALSIGKNPGNAYISEPGRVTYLAAVNRPRFFWWGLGILAFGYLLQIVVQSCQLGLCR
jgi:hypothetical protein